MVTFGESDLTKTFLRDNYAYKTVIRSLNTLRLYQSDGFFGTMTWKLEEKNDSSRMITNPGHGNPTCGSEGEEGLHSQSSWYFRIPLISP